MDRKYYAINEETARQAHYMNSFREFKPGAQTEEYKQHVDRVYDICEKIAEVKPAFLEKALYMADRYSKKLADYFNAYNRNECACPSVMVCGPANFPVRKKEKQNARRESLLAEWRSLEYYKQKINNILTCSNPILSSDENAIEMLKDKIADLEAEKELKKAINAHYRKHGSMEGFDGDISDKLKRHIDFMIEKGFIYGCRVFDTTNVNAEIKRSRARLEELQQIKERGNIETETDITGLTVIENTEAMRLQLVFDEKPDPEVREVLKKNGFRWAPSQNAWQRQLTNNARYSLKIVLNELK